MDIVIDIAVDYLPVFVGGGLLCLVAQIITDRTKLVSGQILVGYIILGVILTALGIYEPFVKFAGAGATVPLTGFGYTLVKGTVSAIHRDGFTGIFTGGLSAASAGVTAAVVSGVVVAFVARAKTKM